jgi:hypothetical protein
LGLVLWPVFFHFEFKSVIRLPGCSATFKMKSDIFIIAIVRPFFSDSFYYSAQALAGRAARHGPVAPGQTARLPTPTFR